MKRLFILMFGLAVLTHSAFAQSTEEQYVRVYNLIQQADALRQSGDDQSALPKYLEAQTTLNLIQRQNPTWQPKVVGFRLNYIASKIAAIPGATPVTTPIAPTTGTPEPKPTASANVATKTVPDAAAQQLTELQNALKQLQAEKTVLESKLKEALATQPATVDPRELTKAQEKVQTLLKENELLKAGLEQEKNRPAVPAVNPKELEDARQALAASNTKLVEQQALNEKLAAEKTSLQEQLGKTATGAEVVVALRAENELLRKQLGEAKAAVTTAADGKTTEAARKLAEAEARAAALASSAEMLRLEKTALEARLKQLPVAAAPVAAVKSASVARSGDDPRIKELERQRDALYKLLEKRGSEAQDAYSKELQKKVAQLNGEVEALQSRLAVFEAKAIPYSAEELALFQQPQTKPALAPVKTAPKAEVLSETKPVETRKPVKELPAGTVALVAQAEKYFAAKQYDKAEENYLSILRQDESNAYTLANLGAIQMEQGRLAEAETNILRALAISPDDAHANSLLGYLKFRQQKYDDAVGALNRAAKLNPQNADIQNYLGVTLTQKGLRGPAEQAFRKAIVLDPNHGGAHNNLAVFYASESTPNLPLARFHYQKALSAGHARNAEIEALLDKRDAAKDKATP